MSVTHRHKIETLEDFRKDNKSPWETGLPKEFYYWIVFEPTLLYYIMVWADSPQGQRFWERECHSETLSPEADLILRSWAGLVKPRKIKPIEWV